MVNKLNDIIDLEAMIREKCTELKEDLKKMGIQNKDEVLNKIQQGMINIYKDINEKKCWELDQCLTCNKPCKLQEGELDRFKDDEGNHECSMICYCGCSDCNKGCLGC